MKKTRKGLANTIRAHSKKDKPRDVNQHLALSSPAFASACSLPAILPTSVHGP